MYQEHAEKKPKLRQDKQKLTFYGPVYPKETSQECITSTHRSSAPLSDTLGVLPSLSLTTKGTLLQLGGGSPSLSLDPITSMYHALSYDQPESICVISEWVNKWVGEWVRGWVSESLSKRVSEWVCERVCEWVSVWVVFIVPINTL